MNKQINDAAISFAKKEMGLAYVADSDVAQTFEQHFLDGANFVLRQTTGLGVIAKERFRHEDMGFDAAHDDQETDAQLAVAAALYTADTTPMTIDIDNAWPWDLQKDKRGRIDRVAQLGVAGALIAAEIDRLMRKESEVTDGL